VGAVATAAGLAVVAALGVGALVAADRAAAAPGPTPAAPFPAPAAPFPPPAASAHTLPGWPLYDRLCLACHGVAGDGAGPAAPWLWPRPRDLTAGSFRWVTTADGAPTRDALARTIAGGAPGTSMPGFAEVLGPRDLDAVVDVVLAFGPPRPVAREGGPLPEVAAVDDAGRARGAAAWKRLGCPSCHGAGGRGDGPAAAALGDRRPYDLTAGPVRWPRVGVGARADEAAIAASIVYGVGGTPMPAYAGALTPTELADLAAHVATLAPRDLPPVPPLAAQAIAADRASRATTAGYRPGAAGDPDGAPFGGTIALQVAPAALAPAQASLSARQCGRCHARQLREWQGSIHARATSPGFTGQLLRIDGAAAESCRRCHAPLAEQQPTLRAGQRGGDDRERTYTGNERFDATLADEGLTCAGCHVRTGVRHGPPAVAASLLRLPGYPRVELPVYERADLCMPCHQLPPRLAVAGRPLLDTYREWLHGPYMKRGVQCQHCHMPDREHTWKGVHDPETFRQGIDVAARARRTATGDVVVRATITNVGAGHYLPTTPTPAAWLELELEDEGGRAIAGTSASRRIGRAIRPRGTGFEELEDTRLPPGGSLAIDRGWRGGRIAAATHLRVRVRVRPDDYYEGLYQRRLADTLPAEARRRFEAALARARASPYVAYDERFAIAAP
jgi:mono/diheme cytochrome c family protein